MVRYALLLSTLMVMTSNLAAAQDWAEFVSTDERFGVNFPGEPNLTEQNFTTASGHSFPSKTYSASDNAGSYSVIAVRFGEVSDEMRESLIRDAADVLRARGGEITYDGVAVYDGMDTQMIQITNADGTKSYIAILQPPKANGLNRFYIAEGRVAGNMPVPGHFQQSLFVVDPNGDRIRYQTDVEGTKFRVIPGAGGQPYLAENCAPGLPCLLIDRAGETPD
jgi:hypothetical protein